MRINMVNAKDALIIVSVALQRKVALYVLPF